MAATKLNLPTIEKGATFRYSLTWQDSLGAPIDLSGCTAKAQIRETQESITILLELSTENGRITITGPTGTIDLYIDDADTAALVGLGGVYDLEVYFPSGDVTRLIEGKWQFKDEVTR